MDTRPEVLICEDTPDDAFFLERAFRAAGVNVKLQFMQTGRQAVDFLCGHSPYQGRSVPALVLTDLNMPGLDGFELLHWLRHEPGIRNVPVIVLSSSECQTDIDRAYMLGANGYWVKPCGLEAYRAMVQRIAGFWLQGNEFPSCCGSIPATGKYLKPHFAK